MPETRLDGVHHFTGITADVTANIDFWCRILGLRFVKKTLNFETTFRYHPYYGDEQGDPGSVVTFLEFKELGADCRATATSSGSSSGSTPMTPRTTGSSVWPSTRSTPSSCAWTRPGRRA